MNNQVYDIVADRILDMLDKGVIPWRKPWKAGAGALPRNGVTGKPYRGVNIFLLHAAGFSNPRWFTFRQAEGVGAHVRKGSKGFPVVFWKFDRTTEEETEGEPTEAGEGKTKRPPILRYYTVFNAEQLDNLPETYTDKPDADPSAPRDPIADADAIVEGMPNRPPITYAGSRAFYRPYDDSIHIPAAESFPQLEEHYSTLFHELAHATGHHTRLNRPALSTAAFGSDTYGREELLAEFAASFLCAVAGIATATVENSAAYIASWKETIKADKPAVVFAAAQAQKAADYILNAPRPEEG